MQGIFLLQKNVSVLANYVQTVLCYSNIIEGNVIQKTNNETEDFTMKRKMVSALLCATMVAGMVVVPAATAQAADKKLIGVTMPTKDLQRWNQDGENMKKELEAVEEKLLSGEDMTEDPLTKSHAKWAADIAANYEITCLLYTSPSPRDCS